VIPGIIQVASSSSSLPLEQSPALIKGFSWLPAENGKINGRWNAHPGFHPET
jgi:hypothetical protein